jgi:hypothetical protein
MRHLALILYIFFNFSNITAQPSYDAKRDYMWIMGHQYYSWDTVDHIIFDFRFDSLKLSSKREVGMNLFQTNGSICDTTGNLLLFSNGCIIMDSSFQYPINADTINRGPKWTTNCDQDGTDITNGYVFTNNMWILPVKSDKYKLFYVDEISQEYNSSGLRSTTIKETPNGLIGYDVDKYWVHSDMQQTERAVTRHANGRDWWFVNNGRQNKKMFVFYVDSTDTAYSPDIQVFDDLPIQGISAGQACFSPDGSKYARHGYKNGLDIWDFNRCNGQLSNLNHLDINDFNTGTIVVGVAFSPNSRFLYIMQDRYIYQYDLSNPDWANSRITVSEADDFLDLGQPLRFYMPQLGPDGKIYIFNPSTRRTFHVMEHPDSLGVACKVVQHKYLFQEWGAVAQPPRFPNFRLGTLTGSPCDTLTIATHDEPTLHKATLRFLPNPAQDYTVVEVTMADYHPEHTVYVVVSDMWGREVGRSVLPPYASLHRVETRGLAVGSYVVSLVSGGRQMGAARLVVLR